MRAKNGEYKKCKTCSSIFYVPRHRVDAAFFCSHKCYSKNLIKKVPRNCNRCGVRFDTQLSKSTGNRGQFCSKSCSIGAMKKGKKASESARINMSIAMYKRFSVKENHPKWKKDRSLLVKRQNRNDSAYQEWRKSVWLRDNFKCKIANPDCKGRLEAQSGLVS